MHGLRYRLDVEDAELETAADALQVTLTAVPLGPRDLAGALDLERAHAPHDLAWRRRLVALLRASGDAHAALDEPEELILLRAARQSEDLRLRSE